SLATACHSRLRCCPAGRCVREGAAEAPRHKLAQIVDCKLQLGDRRAVFSFQIIFEAKLDLILHRIGGGRGSNSDPRSEERHDKRSREGRFHCSSLKKAVESEIEILQESMPD